MNSLRGKYRQYYPTISGDLYTDICLLRYRDRLSFRFLGVRYAPQPKRFTYSEPYVGNGGEVSALEYDSQCVQAGNIGSEDCLFLNIWTTHIPAKPTTKKLKPVMVSIDFSA